MLEVPFTDSTGLLSSYKINAPADIGQKVYGLHIHLHGDGGGGYRDFPNKDARYDLIGVTVKAPNTNLQWGRAQGRAHALYVNELLQKELIKKYNVNLDRIYFSGVSGGAYFLMGSFLPEFGQLYNSAALVLCGGEPPRVAFADPKMLSKFRIHIEVTAGERQDILGSVQSTVTAYKNAMTSAGIAADQQAKIQTLNIQGPGGHCEFDGVSYTTGIQQAIDTKFKMVLPP
jgi:predicted peptidase